MAVLFQTMNFFTLLLTASTYSNAEGALLCAPDPSMPGCICEGTNFRLDISQILPYPYYVSDIRPDLNYSFSPCNPIRCQNTPNAAVVCQYYVGIYEYNCGLIANWTVYSINPQNFSVVYSLGRDKRQTTVKFYQDENATTNSASSVIESPILHYAFSVRFKMGVRSSTLPASSNSMLSAYSTIPVYTINGSPPQDFKKSIAFPVGLAFGLLAGLIASVSALFFIIVIKTRRYRRKRQMTSAKIPSNSIEKGKDGTCISLSDKNEPTAEYSHVSSSKHPPTVAMKPNVAYGMSNKKVSPAGSYVANQTLYDSVDY